MLKKLDFEDYGNQLTATIDNETLSLDVYKIIKAPTYFSLYDNLDTVLDAPINVNLFLGYIEDEETIGVEKGFITLSLTSISGQTIYDKKNIDFIDGQINAQFANVLNVGEYLLQAEYLGNKYYEPALLTIQFSIERRTIKCIFDENYLQGYPNENISTGVTFVDSLNGKKISNCLINYYFNGFKYITQTNEQGHALLNITMPDIDPNICSLETDDINNDENIINENLNVIYFDYDGNIQYVNNRSQFVNDGIESDNENIVIEVIDFNEEDDDRIEYNIIPKYVLEIDVDSTVYKLDSETSIDVFLKKYQTEVLYTITNNDYTIHIEGDVVSYYNDENSNVQYGIVSFDVSEIPPHPQSTVTLDDKGHFSFEKEIVQTENANVSASEPLLYSVEADTETAINIVDDLTEVTRDYINKHKIGFIATITSNNNPVNYGMVTFLIMQDYKEVYRYVTEVNINGEASFYFDVSTIGEYQVKAIYHGMFEYQKSESDIKEYEVVEV